MMFEQEPNKWFYLVEPTDNKRQRSYDEYIIEGPFKAQFVAEQTMLRRHSNPGGWSVFKYEKAQSIAQIREIIARRFKGVL